MTQMKIGAVDRSVLVFIPDPASTDGSGKTALTHTDMTVSYTRVETDNDVVNTNVTSSLSTLSTLTDAHADWGFKEVSASLAPGLYRLDIADAVFATGAWQAVVYVMITSSAAAAVPVQFDLVPVDPYEGVNVETIDGAAPETTANIADAVWDEDATLHQTTGTFGQAIGDPVASTETLYKAIVTDPAGANIAADVIAIKGVLPTTLVSGRIDASVGAMATDVITSGAIATSAVTEIQAGLATAAALTIVDDFLDTEIAAILAAVDTEIAAIKAKTDLLPASPAGVGDAMTLTSGERNAIADAHLNRTDGITTGYTPARVQRAIISVLAGKVSKAGDVFTFRNVLDTLNAITATTTVDGERTAVTVSIT